MSGLEQLYQQVIVDHSRKRAGSGELLAGGAGKSHQVNPTCGDEVTLTVKTDVDGRVSELAWQGQGCSISQASLSMMTELVKGADVSDRKAVEDAFEEMMHSRGQGIADEKLDLLGDASALKGTSKFPARIKCALLGWMALRDALAKEQK